MHRPVALILPLLLLISQSLTGQTDSTSLKVLSGKIVDDSLGYALSSVHLWNESTRLGSISDNSGEFSIRVKSEDTLVFSAIGYDSYVLVVPPSFEQNVMVRLESKKYEIDELVVRRFRSYESFKYQVIHLDLPEEETAELKEHIKVTSIAAALEAERERAINDRFTEFGSGFGYITPLGNGIDRQKAFKEKTLALKERERVIHAKFNRAMVSDLTQLEGDELSEFIALCNFSDDYLYETDLYTVIEALYARLEDYHNRADTIPNLNNHQD